MAERMKSRREEKVSLFAGAAGCDEDELLMPGLYCVLPTHESPDCRHQRIRSMGSDRIYNDINYPAAQDPIEAADLRECVNRFRIRTSVEATPITGERTQ
jgi:hypothetical protein